MNINKKNKRTIIQTTRKYSHKKILMRIKDIFFKIKQKNLGRLAFNITNKHIEHRKDKFFTMKVLLMKK